MPVRLQMPIAAETVGIQLQGKVDPQVAGEGLQPDTLRGCLDDTPKLGLARAEGDRLLGGRPVLQQVPTP